MRHLINLVSAAALMVSQLALPALAAPDDRRARPPGNTRPSPRPPSPQISQPRPQPSNGYRPNPGRPNPGRPDYNRPPITNPGFRPPNYRPPAYPIYRPPGGGYYRPPGGGFYRPPARPPGGWQGGYYPPQRYYYNDGPSVGGILAGVAVTGTLLALLANANKSSNQQAAQGGPSPSYAPPPNSDGAPAAINVDLGSVENAARPSASTCLTEAARQIGATGGREIRLDRMVDVEKGNGGYRFRMDLVGVYPDESRSIPMYCRATPEKIVELTFG